MIHTAPEYVRDHVELAYAATAHRVQGGTVDTAHALVSATTTREVLYVSGTRGRSSNTFYVDTDYHNDLETSHGSEETMTAKKFSSLSCATRGPMWRRTR